MPVPSKLHVPSPQQDLVARPRLLAQLRRARASPLVLLTAPLGYGKTTLLAQWNEADDRPFVWVTVDDADNDPSRLLSYIVFALGSVIPLRASSFSRPPHSGSSFTAFALPRLTRGLREGSTPFVLVLDDVHLITAVGSLDVVAILLENLPTGSQLVLAGRSPPPLPLDRLLVDRSLFSLGVHQLAMTPHEGAELLHRAGLPVGGSEVEMLVGRTEGWAGGLYLAAVALREEPNLAEALDDFAGSDELVTDYLRHEVLERMPPDRAEFTLGTAVLERLSGPLCDAVLGRTGSAAILEQDARTNLLMTTSDRNRTWFRRHHLWAQMVLSELRRRDPAAERVQHRRAATWFEQNGDIDAALDHAGAAGEYELAAEIIARHLVAFTSTGRASTLRRWIEALPASAVARLPWFGAVAVQAYIFNGDIERATQWLGVAEQGLSEDDTEMPDGRASLHGAVATARASLGLASVEEMRRDATIGYEAERDGPWKGFCAFLIGVSAYLSDDPGAAEHRLREAERLTAMTVPNIHAWTIAQLAVCAIERDDWEEARNLAERARVAVERNGLQDYTSASLVYAVSAMTCIHWRQPAEALRDVRCAVRLLTMLSGLVPWMSVQGRIIAANVYLGLGDPAQARETLRPVANGLSLLDAPLLQRRYEETLELTRTQRQVASGGPPLTAAEIRVLQFLPTHLSFREIAERLHVSRNTVKTQVVSVYRKFGADNRTEAVRTGRALGMIGDDFPFDLLQGSRSG